MTQQTTTNPITAFVESEKARTRYEPAPLTELEHSEIQWALMPHRLCVKQGKKHARVYRFKGWKHGKAVTSRDFVYVIHADEYRTDPKGVIKAVLENSKKVYDKSEAAVNNAEYEANMVKAEEDLLINKQVVMYWKASKTARFQKVVHCCTDREMLSVLDEFAKGKTGWFVTNHLRKDKEQKYLEVFKKMVTIFEMMETDAPEWDWHSFRYVTQNGKVVCAYSLQDSVQLKRVAFSKGIHDKFDFNLHQIDKDYIAKVVG